MRMRTSLARRRAVRCWRWPVAAWPGSRPRGTTTVTRSLDRSAPAPPPDKAIAATARPGHRRRRPTRPSPPPRDHRPGHRRARRPIRPPARRSAGCAAGRRPIRPSGIGRRWPPPDQAIAAAARPGHRRARRPIRPPARRSAGCAAARWPPPDHAIRPSGIGRRSADGARSPRTQEISEATGGGRRGG